MRRSTTKYLLSAGLITLGSLMLVPSCVTNDSSMFIVGVIDINATTCLAKADTTEAMLPAGTMDTQFLKSYTAFLLVGNQLTARGAREQLRTETSRVSLRGAEVTLTKLNGDAITDATGKSIGQFSTVGTGFVDAASGDAPSYAAMAVNIIPSGIGALPPVVLAKIRVFGDTLGGASVTSSELDFPITVCNGCLIRYAVSDANPLVTTHYECAIAPSTSTSSTASPCKLGQDEPFSCTLCPAYPACVDPTKNPSYMPATTP